MFITNQATDNSNSSGPLHYKPYIVLKALDFKFRPPILQTINCSQKTRDAKTILFFPLAVCFSGIFLILVASYFLSGVNFLGAGGSTARGCTIARGHPHRWVSFPGVFHDDLRFPWPWDGFEVVDLNLGHRGEWGLVRRRERENKGVCYRLEIVKGPKYVI